MKVRRIPYRKDLLPWIRSVLHKVEVYIDLTSISIKQFVVLYKDTLLESFDERQLKYKLM